MRQAAVIAMVVGLSLAGCEDRNVSVALERGLNMTDTRTGSGVVAGEGSYVECHYTATLPDGKVVIDTRRDRRSHKFVIGDDTVIPGMDYAVRGMRAGGIRQVVMPPESHYGRHGYAGVIPAGVDLAFEISMLQVRDRPPAYDPRQEFFEPVKTEQVATPTPRKNFLGR